MYRITYVTGCWMGAFIGSSWVWVSSPGLFSWRISYFFVVGLLHTRLDREVDFSTRPPRRLSQYRPEVFWKQRIPLPNTGYGAFITVSEGRSYVIWWWWSTPRAINLNICASADRPARNDTTRYSSELSEAALYRTALFHAASDDARRGDHPLKFEVTHLTRRSISTSRLHIHASMFAYHGYGSDTRICPINYKYT